MTTETPAHLPPLGPVQAGGVPLPASPAPSLIEQMKAYAAAENAAAREAWPNWADESLCGNHGKARPMKLNPDEVAEKLAEGWSKSDIARHYGTSKSTVGYCVRKMEGRA